jgi:hypothetical protein
MGWSITGGSGMGLCPYLSPIQLDILFNTLVEPKTHLHVSPNIVQHVALTMDVKARVSAMRTLILSLVNSIANIKPFNQVSLLLFAF